MKRTLLLLFDSLQVNFSSSESVDRRWLIFPCFCQGNILRIGFLIFAETSCTEGLIGWGQLFVQEVSVAVAHDSSLAIGQLLLASSFINRHESGEFGLALLPLRGRADRHPAGVWVAVLVTLTSALPSHGYIWKRPWIWNPKRRTGLNLGMLQQDSWWAETKEKNVQKCFTIPNSLQVIMR